MFICSAFIFFTISSAFNPEKYKFTPTKIELFTGAKAKISRQVFFSAILVFSDADRRLDFAGVFTSFGRIKSTQNLVNGSVVQAPIPANRIVLYGSYGQVLSRFCYHVRKFEQKSYKTCVILNSRWVFVRWHPLYS